MLRLKPRQRDLLIEKVPDVANLGAGSLVFGQILTGQTFSLGWAVLGIAFRFVLFGLMLFAASGE
jgi:1,4-dihydroxy-2-naphthoate octaprenyltransferase